MWLKANFDQISKFLFLTFWQTNSISIGFRLQTQKLESPYKTPSSTLAVKGLKQLCHSIFMMSLFSFFFGSKGWRSGESGTLLPPMWPGFKSRHWRHLGWVCCWFSPLLREVLLLVLRFSPTFKNQHFQIPIRPGKVEPLCGCATSQSLFIILFKCWNNIAAIGNNVKTML